MPDSPRTPIGELARRAAVYFGLDAFASESTAVAPKAEPIDEWGRTLRMDGAPTVGAMFNARVDDRRSRINPPWDPDQIADALKLAESGDLSMQSELFEHMEEKDGRLHGYLNDRRNRPCGLRWSVEASDPDDKEAVKIARFAQREIASIPNWDHGLRDMTDAIGKGLACLQVDWQAGGRSPETKFRIDGLHWINTKRVRFDWKTERVLVIPDAHMGRTLTGLGFDEILSDGYGVVPPAWKVIVHRARTRTTHPAKGGVLRIVPFYFLFRNYSLKDWFIFADKYGMPIRIGKYGPEAGDAEKNELMLALERLGTDAVAMIAESAKIEFLETKNIGANVGLPFPGLMEACAKEYEFAILGNEQTNTENGSGSRAKTESGGAKVVQSIVEADCKDLHATLNQQLLLPIVGYSRYGWDKARLKTPRFRFHYEPDSDYESMSKTDEKVHVVLGLPTTAGELAKRYGKTLPAGMDPDTVLVYTKDVPPGLENALVLRVSKDTPTQPAEDPVQDPAAQSLAAVIARRFSPQFSAASQGRSQGAVDDLTDRSIAAASRAFAKLEGPIQDLILSAKSFDEIEAGLPGLYPNLDARDLQRLLQRTMATINLFARTTVRRVPEDES